MKTGNIRKDKAHKKKLSIRQKTLMDSLALWLIFKRNDERIPISKICFRFSGLHRLNISRIWFLVKSFIFYHAWWPNSKRPDEFLPLFICVKSGSSYLCCSPSVSVSHRCFLNDNASFWASSNGLFLYFYPQWRLLRGS